MSRNNTNWIAFITAGILAFGITFATSHDASSAMQPVEKEPAPPGPDLIGVKIEITAGDSAEMTLMKKMYQCAQTELGLRYHEYQIGRGTLDVLLDASGRLRDSELELATKPADRIRALKRNLKVANGIWDIHVARSYNANVEAAYWEELRYAKLDAELRLLREEKAASATK